MTAPQIEAALVERMVKLVRTWANDARTVGEARQLGIEARAIVAELPEPVDPDREEAIRLRDEAGWNDAEHHILTLMKALKRGRELERATGLATTDAGASNAQA